MPSLVDALWLSLLFAATGATVLGYFQLLPSATHLRQRLPNRISLAGIVLALVVTASVITVFQITDGRATIFGILTLLYHLLIFETILLLLFRWLRSNLLAVVIALSITGGWAWFVIGSESITVYNVTYMLVAIGAPAFLIKMGYLRSRFLIIVALLWSVYDILSNLFIYPAIYRPIGTPIASFRFPAVIAGQITLGLGDFVFLTLFSLALWRDRGPRWAWFHLGLQSVALLIAAAVKPPSIQFPYLVVMATIFLTLWAVSRPPKTAASA